MVGFSLYTNKREQKIHGKERKSIKIVGLPNRLNLELCVVCSNQDSKKEPIVGLRGYVDTHIERFPLSHSLKPLFHCREFDPKNS